MSKNFCAVSDKIGELYISKFSFLAFILWIRRMLFWHLCWELLGESLKGSLPKTINDSNNLFMQNLFPQKYLLDSLLPKFWEFSPESPKVLISFSPKHFFWQNVSLHKWNEALVMFATFFARILKIISTSSQTDGEKWFQFENFFLRTSLLDKKSAVILNIPNVLNRIPKIISSKSETDWKNFSGGKVFFHQRFL